LLDLVATASQAGIAGSNPAGITIIKSKGSHPVMLLSKASKILINLSVDKSEAIHYASMKIRNT
jgi:hypothetical protein